MGNDQCLSQVRPVFPSNGRKCSSASANAISHEPLSGYTILPPPLNLSLYFRWQRTDARTYTQIDRERERQEKKKFPFAIRGIITRECDGFKISSRSLLSASRESGERKKRQVRRRERHI
jgi:hypothetical protein